MIWLYLLAVALLGAVVVLLAGRDEGAQPPGEEDPGDEVATLLEARGGGPLTGEDLREVRLQPALRGYRADQVDALLDALARQLEAAERQDQRQDGGADEGPLAGSHGGR